jgi:hypothetical protein
MRLNILKMSDKLSFQSSISLLVVKEFEVDIYVCRHFDVAGELRTSYCAHPPDLKFGAWK